MKPHTIIVAGYLAAGKSTFARQLSNALSVPCIIKDTFKSALCASVPITAREESSRFSIVTFDAMMYVTERLVETSHPIILEGNFVPYGVKKKDEAGTIRELLNQYECRLLTYKFTADTQVLYKRFIEREDSPERGQANITFTKPSYDEFEIWCHNLDGFNVGGDVVEVDTTDFKSVDFERHIETAREFLGRN